MVMRNLEPNKNRELAVCTIHDQWLIGYYVGDGLIKATTQYVLRPDGKFEEMTTTIHMSAISRWVELENRTTDGHLEGLPRGEGNDSGGYYLTVIERNR